ncbi:hypothetical protein IDH44_15330 [Paenibacillus sp. IB182496]|uniref:SWIM zinc finger domain-containing protein n=1 Tax=Paenibacillus sabuli TaxID=2772509 RepID=A0A927GSR6_9BACL|nr:hypothetical protein [Paenibacillus sabuli]MBD2846571.1 hypothetical protein [Paenibacillus sabuli]
MTRKLDLPNILNGLSREELVQLLLQATELDESFKNTLLMKYTQVDPAGHVQACKRRMKAIVRKYTGREGFIPYRETYSFSMELLEMLDEMKDAKDHGLALEVTILVLQEGVEAFQYADDSDGNVGMVVEGALARIRDLASGSVNDPVASSRIFERLLAFSERDIFDGWEDYRIELLEICTGLVRAEELRDRLKTAIKRHIAAHANDPYGKYTAEALLKLLFQLIREYGSSADAERFVKEHLHYSFFRQHAIEACIDSGDARGAIELALDGERQDQQLPGLVTQWKKARYEAYRKLALKKEQRQLAWELLLGGDYAYYQELVSITEGGKEELYREVVAGLKQRDNWQARAVYLQLIADKNDLEEMMAYVRATPSAVETYAARLSERYPEEMARMYGDAIHRTAESASDRKGYRGVCKMISRYQKIFGQASQAEIVLQLQAAYSRKPAFLDELSKVE